MNLDHHEEIIRKRLQDHRVAVDTGALWSAIEDRMPSGGKKQRPHWLWWTLGVTLVAAFTVAGIIFTTPKPTPQPSPDPSPAASPLAESRDQLRVEEESTPGAVASTDMDSGSSKEVLNGEDTRPSESKEGTSLDQQNAQYQSHTWTKDELDGSSTDRIESPLPDREETNPVSKYEHVTDDYDSREARSNFIPLESSRQMNENISPLQTLPGASEPIVLVNQASHPEIHQSAYFMDNGPKIERQRSPRFSVALHAGIGGFASLSGNQFNEQSYLINTDSEEKLQSEGTSGQLLFAEVLFGYKLNRNLTLKAGLSRSQLTNTLGQAKLASYNITNTDGTSQVIYAPVGSEISENVNFSAVENTGIVIQRGSKEYLRVWQIPFLVDYEMNSGRWMFSFFGGGALNLDTEIATYELRPVIPFDTASGIFAPSERNDFQSVKTGKITGIAGLQIGYQLSPHLTLQAGYQGQYYQLNNENESNRQEILTHGAYAGLGVLL